LLLKVLALGALFFEIVPTNTPVHLTRPRSENVPHMAFVVPSGDGGGNMTLISVDSSLHVGDTFDLVDEQGYAAQARVVEVERTDDHCPGFVYQKAKARTNTVAREVNKFKAIAIGPTGAAVRTARFVPHDDKQALDVPPLGMGAGLQWLVDRDGDGIPDLARYLYECAGGPNVGWAGRNEGCIEDWWRGRSGWQRISHTQLTCK
jgi:hypothetical protein